MQVNMNYYPKYIVSMGEAKRISPAQDERTTNEYLEKIANSKNAVIPPYRVMRNVNLNQRNIFDVFTKVDDATREINFVKSESSWDDCLLEEIEEFTVARKEYKKHPTKINYEHMEEEMGDIFYTASSIAKSSDIDPEQAFKSTVRKFFNRINLMERMLVTSTGDPNADLKNCRDYERRALWNTAKRKLYDAQARRAIDD